MPGLGKKSSPYQGEAGRGMNTDEYFMSKAFALALRAKGRTWPNPLVGAVVVKNGKIIGQGYHKKAGLAHAEVEAICAAGKGARGASLYVTLEPCAHYGRTPPCVDKIIESGIKRVLVGMVDPNPLNNGKGIKLLKEHRIKIETGFLRGEKIKKGKSAFYQIYNPKNPFYYGKSRAVFRWENCLKKR